MCEQPLVAWIDGELHPLEAARVEDHVKECGKCAARVESYRGISDEVRVWSRAQPHAPLRARWRVGRTAAWAAVAAAAVVVLGAALYSRPEPRREVALMTRPQVDLRAETRLSSAPAVTAPVRTRERAVARRPAVEPVVYAGAVVRVALPADELLPPGAVPAGTQILADVTFAADGSPTAIRLLP